MKVKARISSNESGPCPFCGNTVFLNADEDFLKAANHLQEVHALTCLHVGQETVSDDQGRLYQTTVAFFGL
jgi:hypothetical protein